MKLEQKTEIFRWRPACCLRASGTDATAFLQGQFTNDLRAAAGAVYGLWLNVKGKVIGDSFVVPKGDAYRLISYESPAEQIRARLDAYIIADDVTLEDETAQWGAVTLIGPGIGDEADSWMHSLGGHAFAGRRLAEPHVECVFPLSRMKEVEPILASGSAVTAAEIERRRIAAALPAIPRDIGPTDLPNEAGLESVAISYTKGCYLGQEVMARLKNLGQVRRKLVPVKSTDAMLPTLPAPLYLEQRPVGELRSAIGTEEGVSGLALLSLVHVRGPASLALSPGGATTFQTGDLR